MELMGRSKASLVAWGIALLTVVTNVWGLYVAWIYGRLGLIQLAYLGAILVSFIAAVVMSRQPRNVMGRLLAIQALAVGLSIVPFAYGATGFLAHGGEWPGARFALWLDAWLWLLPFGLGTPAIITRFPEGRIDPGWRWIDYLAAAGVGFLVLWAALSPGPMFPFGIAGNPFGLAQAKAALAVLGGVGLVLIVAAMVGAVISLAIRFRTARGDERQQIKWIVFAGALIGATIVYAIPARLVFNRSLVEALLPFSIAVLAGPLALGVAILRYRLYDIDLIINRTLVYGALTAILAGLYTAGVTLMQRLYMITTGQRSDAALVITAFAIATLFTPIRGGLQKVVDRTVGGRDPVGRLDFLTASVESVLRVMDGRRIAQRLIDDAVEGYQARFGALYLDLRGAQSLVYSAGSDRGEPALDLDLACGGRAVGRLVLGPRRGGHSYSQRDRMALKRCADAVAEALELADNLGHSVEPNWR